MANNRKGVVVGLKELGNSHTYAEASGASEEEGKLLVLLAEGEEELVLGMYPPGEWTYVKYVQP